MSKLNITDYNLHQLHELRLKGEITTLEIVEQTLERITKFDGKVKSFLTVFGEESLNLATVIDAKIKNKKEISPLAGMPISLKDIFNLQGKTTTAGSKILTNYVSPYDATVVEKLKSHSAGFIGKTNMDEFAMGSSTENSSFFSTLNPYNLKRVPGGSSGGSAAAVAAKFCIASLGTDTGGSVRQPAGFCGVVGIKPTYGLVSRYGIVSYGSSLEQAGVIANCVQDAALILDSIKGYDPYDANSLNVSSAGLLQNLKQDVRGLKVALIKNLDLTQCSPAVRDNFFTTIEILRAGGAKIMEVEIPNIANTVATYYITATAEASSNLSRYDGIRYGLRSHDADKLSEIYKFSRQIGFGEEVKLRILLGTFVLSAGYYEAYYGKAQKIKALLTEQFKQVFKKVDLIATPTAPTTAFKLGQNITDPLKLYLSDVFTVPANLTGVPAISVLSGFDGDNLPIGFQLMAGHLRENLLIKAGDWLERNIKIPKVELEF